ncbi:hypothetical protein CYMTET_49499 [Cymbomonas tetramitiformis]|uniref:Uncharacterized protein n=1 Tax=Cymbomonas tetramitiformis TaxID=36881 RepID=A0AAE0BQ60_9CHLO|nr:hypothetical protein CYMTET_49499 [Cymbomonas tetramitiformis]
MNTYGLFTSTPVNAALCASKGPGHVVPPQEALEVDGFLGDFVAKEGAGLGEAPERLELVLVARVALDMQTVTRDKEGDVGGGDAGLEEAHGI